MEVIEESIEDIKKEKTILDWLRTRKLSGINNEVIEENLKKIPSQMLDEDIMEDFVVNAVEEAMELQGFKEEIQRARELARTVPTSEIVLAYMNCILMEKVLQQAIKDKIDQIKNTK